MTPDEAAPIVARQVWTRIGLEFNVLRQRNRTLAWRTYQQRINEHAGILSEIMSAKDLVELSMKIEDYLKDESGGNEENGLDVVQRFLEGTVQ